MRRGPANLIGAVEDAGQAMARVANDLAARFSFRFAGIDFSLAPFPDAAHSIGAALEKLTGAKFGEHGTLFAAVFVTDCLRRAVSARGFFGFDAAGAGRCHACGALTALLDRFVAALLDRVRDRVDTVPLPGETSADTLAAILLDLATLAVRLDKPLTARRNPYTGAGRRRPG